jgi:hypothetical protein
MRRHGQGVAVDVELGTQRSGLRIDLAQDRFPSLKPPTAAFGDTRVS